MKRKLFMFVFVVAMMLIVIATPTFASAHDPLYTNSIREIYKPTSILLNQSLNEEIASPTATVATISPSTTRFRPGETQQYTCSVTADGTAVTWYSSNSAVATVDSNGVLTTLSQGYTVLTARWTGGSKSVTILVGELADGTYFIGNKGNGLYMELEGPSSSDGTNIQQWEFHGYIQSRWKLTLNNDGYYVIRSAYTNKCIGIEDITDGANAAVKQYKYDRTDDTQRWRIIKTDSGGYKLVPKAAGDDDLAVAVPLSGTFVNGSDLLLYYYTDNTNYRDEWEFFEFKYGIQTYRTVTDTDINCHGYALMRNDWPTGWWDSVGAYVINSVAGNQVMNVNDDYSNSIQNNVATQTKSAFESWLDANGYTYELETNFTGNGSNRTLNENQYRIVLRTGVHNIYYTAGVQNYFVQSKVADYHFWYQTYDGSWAHKPGGAPSEHLPIDDTPFTAGSSGWQLRFTYRGNSYFLTNFYSSTIYSYIITI